MGCFFRASNNFRTLVTIRPAAMSSWSGVGTPCRKRRTTTSAVALGRSRADSLARRTPEMASEWTLFPIGWGLGTSKPTGVLVESGCQPWRMFNWSSSTPKAGLYW